VGHEREFVPLPSAAARPLAAASRASTGATFRLYFNPVGLVITGDRQQRAKTDFKA
jgi:hypothetical protein